MKEGGRKTDWQGCTYTTPVLLWVLHKQAFVLSSKNNIYSTSPHFSPLGDSFVPCSFVESQSALLITAEELTYGQDCSPLSWLPCNPSRSLLNSPTYAPYYSRVQCSMEPSFSLFSCLSLSLSLHLFTPPPAFSLCQSHAISSLSEQWLVLS